MVIGLLLGFGGELCLCKKVLYCLLEYIHNMLACMYSYEYNYCSIFSYHHYHSKAWELLICIHGEATIQFGGDSGPTASVATGDLLLIPPGLAHKQLDEKNGFALLGSYPTVGGFDDAIDTLTGSPTKEEMERIVNCHVPEHDPIFHLDVLKLCQAP